MAENPIVELSDEELVARARGGDTAAYGALWARHAHAGVTVARHFTTSSEADDLVAEAFIHILQALRNGRGPTIAFRPYLYATIRNQAKRWGRMDQEISTDFMDALEALPSAEDPMEEAANTDLTVRAFRSLPARWQAILWYTQVERMDPHEVAPLLGITANNAASLAFRAKDGLRSAWVQMHIAEVTTAPDCHWARERLGEFARNRLTTRESLRLRKHLRGCSTCEEVSAEAMDVAARLTLVLAPLLLGVTVGSSLLSHGGTVAVAGAVATTPLAAATGTAAGATASVAAAAWTAPVIAAGVAAATALAAFVLPSAIPEPAEGLTSQSSAQASGREPEQGGVVDPGEPGQESRSMTGIAVDNVAPLPPAIATPVEGALLATSTPGLSGQGEPGAVVHVYLGGAEVGGAPVDAMGQWSIAAVQPLADGPAALTVTQHDSTGNESAPSARTVTLDTVALAPIVQILPTEDGLFAPSASGLGEPGSILQLTDENGTALCTVTVDQQGAWACGELSGLAPGNHALSATQIDPAGNASAASAAVPFSIATIEVALAGSECSAKATCTIRLAGKPDALLRVLLDGVPQVFRDRPHDPELDYVQLNRGGQAPLRLNLGSGQHRVTVFYFSASSGRQSQTTSIDIIVG